MDGALSFRLDGRLDAKFEVVPFEPRCGGQKTGLNIFHRWRCFFRIVVLSILCGLHHSDRLENRIKSNWAGMKWGTCDY